MTPNISIIALIYSSTKYADFVYNAIKSTTPELESGEAEFFFVANEATDELKNHLRAKEYNWFEYSTGPQPPYPENLPFIYRAWNFGASQSNADIIVFINSDMFPGSSDWLTNLVKHVDYETVVTSRLVESGKMPSGKHGISKNFGRSPDEFNREEFFEFVKEVRQDGVVREGGLYMPCALERSSFERVGGYPPGNINGVPGDRVFFYKLKVEQNIDHVTAFDSIVYHIQEGETDE